MNFTRELNILWIAKIIPMTKKKSKLKKQKQHYLYIQRKQFYRKHGRKLTVLLDKNNRKTRKNKKNSTKKTISKSQKIIRLPYILSLKKQHRNKFLKSISELQQYLPSKKYLCSIDHSKIIKIEPEALLVLAAEIKRSVSNKDIDHLRYKKKYAPKNKKVLKMLSSIGYWEHFNIQKDFQKEKNVKFLKILHDTTADNSHVVNMRDFFNSKIKFLPQNTTAVFDIAISEAIANSVEHAYIKDQKMITIKRAWWISGYYDENTKELSFCCYDQGIGIKKALGNHDNRLMMKWVESISLKTKNDSDVLEALVNEELPKYKKKDRGHGFKQFIKFIENYTSGSLNIYSYKGKYEIIKEKKDIIKKKYDYDDVLSGTLIVWKIKHEGELK